MMGVKSVEKLVGQTVLPSMRYPLKNVLFSHATRGIEPCTTHKKPVKAPSKEAKVINNIRAEVFDLPG